MHIRLLGLQCPGELCVEVSAPSVPGVRYHFDVFLPFLCDVLLLGALELRAFSLSCFSSLVTD